jgi:hypothetical protein
MIVTAYLCKHCNASVFSSDPGADSCCLAVQADVFAINPDTERKLAVYEEALRLIIDAKQRLPGTSINDWHRRVALVAENALRVAAIGGPAPIAGNTAAKKD